MILPAVFRATYAELLRSPMRVGLVVFLVLKSLLGATFGSPNVSSAGILFAVVLGVGLIGRPLTNGTLALLFTRPVLRTGYVVTRWLAAASAASLCALAVQALVVGVQLARFGHVDWSAVGITCGEDVLSNTGTVAVLTLLSSLVGGNGDIALLVMLWIAGNLANGLGRLLSHPWLSWVGTQAGDLISPSVDLVTTFGSVPISGYAVAAYLSTVTLCLAGAAEIVRRKEVSYASGGD
jgi:hypothetical protein